MTYDELPLFRRTDPPTSRAGAINVALRLDSQQHKLLKIYGHPSAVNGLTDDEAGQHSQLDQMPKCCYWKRCSELRAKGFIRTTLMTRPGRSGSPQMVCQITDAGHNELGRLRMEHARRA